MSQTRLAKTNSQSVPKVLWNGEHRQFFSWHANVVRELRSEGLESCIRPNFVIPLIPQAAMDAVENGRANAAQSTLVFQYQTKMESNDIKCQKAFGLISSSIGEDMEQRFDHIISNRAISSRDKVFQLYEAIVNSYSRDTRRSILLLL